MKIGDRFKTTATLHKNPNETFFVNFDVSPKHRMMWGISKEETIYEVEFEIAEINPPYPKDTQKIEYFGYLMDGHERVGLIQANVILFTIQFPSPIFNYDEEHLKLGTVFKLNLISATELKD